MTTKQKCPKSSRGRAASRRTARRRLAIAIHGGAGTYVHNATVAVSCGASGGRIAVDRAGRIVRYFSGLGMHGAQRTDVSKPTVALHAEP